MKFNKFMLIVSVLQLAAAIEAFCKGNTRMGLIFVCYTISGVLLAIEK